MQVFNKDMEKDTVVLLAARASRLENQDAIDEAIVNMLADPKEVGLENNKKWYYASSVGTTILFFSGH